MSSVAQTSALLIVHCARKRHDVSELSEPEPLSKQAKTISNDHAK